MSKRNATVDLGKFIASILIIAIHTGLFSDVNESLSFVVVHILCRLAVPFFAICTGCFLREKLIYTEKLEWNSHNKFVFWKQEKRLLAMYSVWTLIYLFHSIPLWVKSGWFSPFAFVDYAIGALTKGSHYHFWYLWGLIYTLPVLIILLYAVPKRFLPYLTAVLWLLKAATYGYSQFLPQTIALKLLQKAETLLCLLPLLLTGVFLPDQSTKKTPFFVVGFGLSLLGLTTEAFLLKNIGQTAFSYILFTLPTGYFLVQLCLKTKITISEPAARNLGSLSMFIYCFHPIIVELTANVISNSVLHFFVTAALSTLMGVLYILIKDRIKRKKVELCSN